ncbi:PRD domain-containing protein [Agrilactobacillus fermenti]|uniref:PRD domain-containing protein n=1 Tax=Agrilactobacillus fermenti TaxID=2586909 RepID=UPI003A5BB667
MDLSNREAEIALLMLRNPQGLTISDLTKGVNVSRRTIYRELSSLETALAHLTIQLVKTEGTYHLVAAKADLDQLQHELLQSDNLSFSSVVTRQSALAVRLLLSNQIVPTKTLADEFEVSNATITQDLNTIEPIFTEYQLTINRIKAKGIAVSGKESNVRRVVSGVLSSEINEYEFFEYLNNTNQTGLSAESDSQYFIATMDAKLLRTASQSISQRVKANFAHFSDSQLKQLIIILTVSAQRIQQGKLITKLDQVDKNALFKYQPIAIELYQQFPSEIRSRMTLMELEFMAQQVQGMSFTLTGHALMDDYDLRLSYQVRNLIQMVSQTFGYDFRGDSTLFTDLMAHLAATLHRATTALPEINNRVLQNVVTNYPKLYQQIQLALTRIFPDEKFSNSEVAYVLLHFASAFEQQRKVGPIRALVLCANGVGTARVLESRLKKMIPEISEFKVSRVAELNHLDMAHYDLVLSTIFLPGFKYPYKVISPLLLDDEVKDIKNYLVNQFGVHSGQRPVVPDMSAHQATADFDHMYDRMQQAKQILDSIEVTVIDNRDLDLAQTLLLLTKRLRPVYVRKPRIVADALLRRMQRAPVGLPDSGLALVHTTTAEIGQPLFAIYELTNPLTTMGMDYQPMTFKRAFFMIAPTELSNFTADLLGDISGSVVENETNLKLFQTATTTQPVRNLVSSIFLKRIFKQINLKN